MKYKVHTISFQTEVISSGCTAFVVPFQLLEGPMEVLLSERVSDLFHLLNGLRTTASELRKKSKVTGSKVWTIGKLRNCLNAHFGQIICDGGWSCGLVYCPGGNATHLIWRVLASSNGISSWTPLKPQHNNPNPINTGVLTSLFLPHLSSLIDSLSSLNLLCHSKTDAPFMQDAPKAVWRIPYVSLAFFTCLKYNFIAYRSSKVSDCIFEIHQL